MCLSGDVLLQKDMDKPVALSFLACKAMGATCCMEMGGTAAETWVDVTAFQRQRALGQRMYWPLPQIFELLKFQFYQGHTSRWMNHRWKPIQELLSTEHSLTVVTSVE